MVTHGSIYNLVYLYFIMKKSLIALAIAGMTTSCGVFNGNIRQEAGVGKVYSVELEEGLNQISKHARRAKLEDLWVLNNDSCYDKGYNSRPGQVSFEIADMMGMDIDSNTFVVHSHNFKFNGEKRLYSPPSVGDMINRNIYSMLGFSSGHVGCVDITGFWTYDWLRRPKNEKENQKVFSGYYDLCVNFINRQEDADFNFYSELLDFRKGALDLGIEIGYRELEGNNFFLRRKGVRE